MTVHISNPDNCLFVYDEISEEQAARFQEHLMEADKQVRRDGLTVRVISHGGCANAGFAIYDAIQLARNRVTTEGWGPVESAGVLVFQAGSRRLMAPNARILLHDIQTEGSSSTGSRGLQARVKDIAALETMYARILAERAGCPEKQVRQWMKAITTFSAAEAVKHGLADGILTKRGP